MAALDWVSSPFGRARFRSTDRGADDMPHNIFAVQIDNRAEFYGEFRPVYEADGKHYSIQIVSFGYSSIYNVANPAPTARALYSPEEVANIQQAIQNLILADDNKPFPVERRAGFLGQILFEENWIRAK